MAHDSTFLIPEVAAQPTPQGGSVAIYAKTDKQLYYKDDTGAESLLGSDTNQVTTNTAQTITGAKTMTGANAFNGTLGATTPAAASVTTLGASGQITSTVATGAAPLVVASTTVVANLNASALGGATFAAPGEIGGGTPAAITGTVITVAAGGSLVSDSGVAVSTAAAATVDKMAGIITTEALTTAADTAYSFALTNALITANSNLLVQVGYGTATTGHPNVRSVTPAAGSATIIIHNDDVAVALNGTLIIQFFLVKP